MLRIYHPSHYTETFVLRVVSSKTPIPISVITRRDFVVTVFHFYPGVTLLTTALGLYNLVPPHLAFKKENTERSGASTSAQNKRPFGGASFINGRFLSYFSALNFLRFVFYYSVILIKDVKIFIFLALTKAFTVREAAPVAIE